MRGWLMVVAVFLVAGRAGAQEDCGPLANAYGPFDYRTQKNMLAIVERAHFTPVVESLKRGQSGALGLDIDYTLRASPNHARALMAVMRLGERAKSDRPGLPRSVPCYFDRAIRFRPDDGTVRMIYGIYLAKRGKVEAALVQLELAQQLEGQNGNLNYNLGLIYFDLKQYDKAVVHARRAQKMGFDLPGLRSKLEKAGKWRELTEEERRAEAALDGADGSAEASTPGGAAPDSGTQRPATAAPGQ